MQSMFEEVVEGTERKYTPMGLDDADYTKDCVAILGLIYCWITFWYIIISKTYNIIKKFALYTFCWYKICAKWIYTCQVMVIWSIRGLVMPRSNQYEL